MKNLIPQEEVEQKIFMIRGQKVMLSTHLEEYEILKSQFVTSSWGGIRRANPYAFTEQGVAMLSSILHSKRAIQVNIAIMRAFVKLRQIL